jgi:endo-alpha-1,4-polygalactosaminidase (GH114 family)
MTSGLLAGTVLSRADILGAARAAEQPKAGEAAPATPPQRQLGPPPGAGEGLEGSGPEPEKRPEPEAPLIPVPPPAAKPATANKGGPDAPDRTRVLVGETEILDIPLAEIPNYRDNMRNIVADLATYARTRDPKFIVATRGGFDLLGWSRREFDLEEIKRDPMARVRPDTIMQVGMPVRQYVQQLDGLILNGQFCAPLRIPRDELDEMRELGVKLLSIEHCKDAAFAAAARTSALQARIVSHIDIDKTDKFAVVPKGRPTPENSGNVEVLGAAKNMLVMLDNSAYASREEWLAALQATNYDVLITDAFFKGKQNLTKNEVHALKFKEMGARRLVLARMNVGFAEDERFYWKREWKIGEPSWIQAFSPERSGQYVVEFWNPAWKAIIGKYFAGIMDLGFDGVVLDGVEAYRRWEFMTPIDPTQIGTVKKN